VHDHYKHDLQLTFFFQIIPRFQSQEPSSLLRNLINQNFVETKNVAISLTTSSYCTVMNHSGIREAQPIRLQHVFTDVTQYQQILVLFKINSKNMKNASATQFTKSMKLHKNP